MICQEVEGKIIYIRDDWKEWFRFRISNTLINLKPRHRLPFFYVKTYEEFTLDTWVYYIFLLVPFVLLWRWIVKNCWWRAARFCRRKGWLIIEEGVAYPYFWIKDLRIFKEYLYSYQMNKLSKNTKKINKNLDKLKK